MERKKVFIMLLILFCAAAFAGGNAYCSDAPHNEIQLMQCLECHAGPKTAPWSLETPIDDYQWDLQCLYCHEPGSPSSMRPKYKTIKGHSSFATSNKYGSYQTSCTSCHDPHRQYQVRLWKTAAHLESGKITSATRTTLTDSTPGKFAGKDYTGYILVPNTSAIAYNYVITGNDDNTISVRGDMNLDRARPGDTYAITYGKMVKAVVNGKYVKFFSNTGPDSFADDDSAINGICQVCHTRTASFTNYGTLEGANHPPSTAGTNCMTCHPHSEGFKAVSQ